MKPAARRAHGATSGDARAAIERFLKASQKPALLEPGEDWLALVDGSFSLEEQNARLTLQAWDQRRNLVRRVVAIHQESPGRLELVVERFARKQGRLFLVDLARSWTQDWDRRGLRLAFRERFRGFLSRQFPDWRIAELSVEADLEHSLSPVYPRALLVKGSAGIAAIAAGPDMLDSSGILSFGLIWLDYLRRRAPAIAVESLALFMANGQERTTCLRLAFLDSRAARFEVFGYSGEDSAAKLDLRDRGNLETHLDICRRATHGHAAIANLLDRVPEVEQVEGHDGEISLRVSGLEFAHTRSGDLRFGLAQRREASAHNSGEIEQLARELARVRTPSAKGRDHPLYRRQPEAWLESRVRAELETVDASLLPAPVYGQVPAFAAAERSVIDLLAVDASGRLAVLELKATADVHLPLQALDYWMRVKWHLDRGEFTAAGYFPGIALRPEPPRLLLIAPAFEFHPSSEAILRFFAPDVEVERIGLGAGWRASLQVMFRLRGAQTPL